MSQTSVKKMVVDFIIHCLNRMFKKYSTVTKYQALEVFRSFKRPSNMSIQAYLNEFGKKLFKTTCYDTIMSEDILAYRSLKSANLSSYHEELEKQP